MISHKVMQRLVLLKMGFFVDKMYTSYKFHTANGAVTLSLRSLSEGVAFHHKTARTFLPSKKTGEHFLTSITKYKKGEKQKHVFIDTRGYRLMVNSLSSTQMIWVRFPLSAHSNT